MRYRFLSTMCKKNNELLETKITDDILTASWQAMWRGTRNGKKQGWQGRARSSIAAHDDMAKGRVARSWVLQLMASRQVSPGSFDRSMLKAQRGERIRLG